MLKANFASTKRCSSAGTPVYSFLVLATVCWCLGGFDGVLNKRVAPVPTVPYRRQPGCHKVGYTRLISVPGCVVFNLTTNACRGFCMSYSIPIAQDLGPLDTKSTVDMTGADVDAAPSGASNWPPSNYVGELIEKKDAAGSAAQENNPSKEFVPDFVMFDRPNNRRAIQRHIKRGFTDLFRSGDTVPGSVSIQVSTDNWPLSSNDGDAGVTSTRDSLIGSTVPIGFESAKRDVVSVSQCCSMMESEEVSLNVRCVEGMRRMVFKSAKACECFFCKRV